MVAGELIWGAVALLGLVVGSFLNVVIYRLPRMLEAQWDEARHEQASDHTTQPPAQRYNIATPGSHCPHCGHVLSWSEKIPVSSYLWLKGRCRQCEAPIGWRYPAIELLTAAFFVWIFQRHGLSAQAFAWAGFVAALLTLAAIDADTTLLPDAITQPLVWSGLLAASLNLSAVSLPTALWGAVVGYLLLWSVYWLFKWATGKEGMGQGDFKLLAALGAWLGWPALLSVVLIASVSGVAIGLWLRVRQRLAEDGYIPFGPYLALAGLWVMALGPLPVLPV
jgi:leader peptidase (prepilin peptidase)/N-methyltransferase